VKGKGFTLIELLIVIAIILILIAIALPNFLEAQIRAKVARVKSELRTLDTAMHEYYLDFNIYPPEDERDNNTRGSNGLRWLTSPIPYIVSLPEDPFGGSLVAEQEGFTVISYESGGVEAGITRLECTYCMVTWMIFSAGPDHVQGIYASEPTYDPAGGDVRNYSATNGTNSRGSIYLWGGDSSYIGVKITSANPKFLNDPSRAVGLTVDGVKYFKRFPAF
jgi:type II secretion system protein G